MNTFQHCGACGIMKKCGAAQTCLLKKEQQKEIIKEIMKTDENAGLYEPNVNYDDERFDLTQQAWVTHVPKTDDEMWLQAVCNDIWAKWQSDRRVLVQMVKNEKHEKAHYERLLKQKNIELDQLKDKHDR